MARPINGLINGRVDLIFRRMSNTLGELIEIPAKLPETTGSFRT
jgi:hypothetical protein